MKRTVTVEVTKREDTPMGVPNGRHIFHVMETGRPTGLFVGCPLGRDYTESSAIADFIFRANADDEALQLTAAEVVVVSRVGGPW